MISPQALISAFCIVLYLVSTILCLGLFMGRHLRKVAQHRRLQQRSCQFPCGNCRYFTGESRLMCAVNPVGVLTEAAMSCQDFEANQNLAALRARSRSFKVRSLAERSRLE